MNIPQSARDRENVIVNLIQSKFGENIKVIDKLHKEKKEIEIKYKALQLYVNNIQNNSNFNYEYDKYNSIDIIKGNDNKKNNKSNIDIDEFVDAYAEDNTSDQYSAADMASLFEFEDAESNKMELLKKFNIDNGLDQEITEITKETKSNSKKIKGLSIQLMADQDR
jgi:hypothetical protein